MNTEFKAVFMRFARAFVAGGLASIAAMLALGAQVKSWEDLGQFVVALAIAFMTGGLMALDKLLRYKNESGEIDFSVKK